MNRFMQAVEGTVEIAEGMDVLPARTMSFWDLFTSGGWLMWVLLALGALAVFLFVERFIAIRRASRMNMGFMNRIRDKISDGNVAGAL
jgi:biopolymer transport protein ExbB